MAAARGCHRAVNVGMFAIAVVIAAGGCGQRRGSAASELRTKFPERAESVLHAGGSFTRTQAGFSSPPSAAAPGAVLPSVGESAIRLSDGRGFEVRVFELGLDGPASPADEAIAYSGRAVSSFWASSPAGLEEWLLVDERPPRAPAALASWRVEGARLRSNRGVAELVDENGVVRIAVSAPTAYSSAGAKRRIELRVSGNVLQLFRLAPGNDAAMTPCWSIRCGPLRPRCSATATFTLPIG
jgi:hypothetical protein